MDYIKSELGHPTPSAKIHPIQKKKFLQLLFSKDTPVQRFLDATQRYSQISSN